MTENIKKIFSQNIKLLALVDKAVIYFREEQYDKALGLSAQTVNMIKDMTDAVIEDREYFRLVSVESVVEMIEGLLETKKKKDYVLLADLFEMQLSTFICNVQELIINKENFLAFQEEEYNEKIRLLEARLTESLNLDFTDKDIIERYKVNQSAELGRELEPGELLKDGYRVEFTSCGQMTVGSVDLQGREFYLHSNNKVSVEAFLLAKSWFAKEADTYLIYGMGMGYHIQELLYVAPYAKIEIYEADMNILKLFCAFSNLKELLSDDEIKIVYDPDGSRMRKRFVNIKSNEKICIHYPSMCNVKDIDMKETLMDYIPWAKLIENC